MASQWNGAGTKQYKQKQYQDIWIPPPKDNITYTYHTVDSKEEGRLDLISYRVYGRPDYFWVIAQFNNILDPMVGFSTGDVIAIPNLTQYFASWRGQSSFLRTL